jgi:hypothetical protein
MLGMARAEEILLRLPFCEYLQMENFEMIVRHGDGKELLGCL